MANKKTGSARKVTREIDLDTIVHDEVIISPSGETDVEHEMNNSSDYYSGAEDEHTLKEIDVNLIDPSDRQQRTKFNQQRLQELSGSIKEKGVFQPVKVRPTEGGRYMLVFGERRLKAAKLAGLETIPAIVDWNITPDKAEEQTLLENIHREGLDAYGKALGVARLRDRYLGKLTDEEFARTILHKDRKTLYNWLSISSIPKDIFLNLYRHGLSTEKHIRSIRMLKPNEELMEQLKNDIITQGLSGQAALDKAREIIKINEVPKDTPATKTLRSVNKLINTLRTDRKKVTKECIKDLLYMSNLITQAVEEFKLEN